MGFTEVAQGDGPVDCSQDRRQGDVGGVLSQDVPATDAPLGSHQARALERQQDLLEVGLGEPRALGDVADRCGPGDVEMQRQRQQRPAGVVASC